MRESEKSPCHKHITARVGCRMDVLRFGGGAVVGNLEGDKEIMPGALWLYQEWSVWVWVCLEGGRAEDVRTSQKWTNSPCACGCSGKSNFVSLRGFIWPPGISHHSLPCAGWAGRELEHLELQWGSFFGTEEAKDWMSGFGLGWERSGCWGWCLGVAP